MAESSADSSMESSAESKENFALLELYMNGEMVDMAVVKSSDYPKRDFRKHITPSGKNKKYHNLEYGGKTYSAAFVFKNSGKCQVYMYVYVQMQRKKVTRHVFIYKCF